MSEPPILQPADDRCDLISDGLATVIDASKFLRIGRSKVYDMMDRGELTYSKIGRCRRIPWKAIHQLAANSLVGSSLESLDDGEGE
jgi:excisionase family DNA binding protein